MDTHTKRLFVAIPPPESTHSEIHETQRRIQILLDASRVQAPGRIRWTPDDRLHVTLLFAAAFPATHLDRLSRAVAEISAAFPPIEIELANALVKPSRGKPRLLWFPVTGGAERLRTLHGQLRDPFQIPQPGDPVHHGRDFVPHLTLGRISGNASPAFSRALRKSVEAGPPPPPPAPWRADRIELVESTLEKGGARHTVLHRFPLAGES